VNTREPTPHVCQRRKVENRTKEKCILEENEWRSAAFTFTAN
jgi:hypothetical protein